MYLTLSALVTLDSGNVTRLRTFLCRVSTFITVATLDYTFIGAVGRTVSLLTICTLLLIWCYKTNAECLPAVITLLGSSSTGSIGAVLSKVALSIALAAFGIRTGNARILALGRTVTFLSTVAASIEVLARLGTITQTVIQALAVVALEDDDIVLSRLEFTLASRVALAY